MHDLPLASQERTTLRIPALERRSNACLISEMPATCPVPVLIVGTAQCDTACHGRTALDLTRTVTLLRMPRG